MIRIFDILTKRQENLAVCMQTAAVGCTTVSKAVSIYLSSPLTLNLDSLRLALGGIVHELLYRVASRSSVSNEFRILTDS